MKRQGIYTFTPENAVLLRNILVSAPIRKPGRGGYVDSCRVPALFRSTNLKLFYLRSINPMIEKINPTIPIPITSSPIPDEQREIIMAKSSIAIPNPIFFIVNPPLQIPICFSISYSNYTIKLVNNSTATLDYMRKVRTVFCPDFLTQS